MRNLVIGLGSGRCGTYSLHNLLDRQDDFICTHEEYLLPWIINEKLCIHNIVQMLLKDFQNIGDVACSWLNYVPFIIPFAGDVKFICLKRDKQATVKSLCNHKKSRNLMVALDSKYYFKEDEHLDSNLTIFPKYDLPKEEAVSRYYDDYYSIAETWELAYPYNFKIFPLDDLNSEKGQRRILNFAGIKNHVYCNEKFHTSGSLLLELQFLEERTRIYFGTLCQICQEPAKYHMVCRTYPRNYYLCDDDNCLQKTIEKMQRTTGVRKYSMRVNRK